MEEKSIKINVPDGYEIDKVNSSFTEIRLKPIESKYPKSWMDAFDGTCLSGYYIDTYAKINYLKAQASSFDMNSFKTEKQAKAMLAYAQITQLMALPCYNGDWEPDWTYDGNIKYYILRYKDNIGTTTTDNSYSKIAFKSEEARDAFYDNHMDLLKTYFELD